MDLAGGSAPALSTRGMTTEKAGGEGTPGLVVVLIMEGVGAVPVAPVFTRREVWTLGDGTRAKRLVHVPPPVFPPPLGDHGSAWL